MQDFVHQPCRPVDERTQDGVEDVLGVQLSRKRPFASRTAPVLRLLALNPKPSTLQQAEDPNAGSKSDNPPSLAAQVFSRKAPEPETFEAPQTP